MRFLLAAVLLALLLVGSGGDLTPRLRAQDDPIDPGTTSNPTGDSGSYSGLVTTGGAYDPFTGNATRTVVDAVTPGASGSYGLTFSRTANSRRQLTAGYDAHFGDGGNWRHSYQWAMTRRGPGRYLIAYPDGRVIEFFNRDFEDGYLRGPLGTTDRLQQVSPPGFGAEVGFILLLSDGGRVVFADRGRPATGYPNSFIDFWRAEQLIDPFGAVTRMRYGDQVSYQPEENPIEPVNVDKFMLTEVTEPAGRALHLIYRLYIADNRGIIHNGPSTPSGGVTTNSPPAPTYYRWTVVDTVQVVYGANVLTQVAYSYDLSGRSSGSPGSPTSGAPYLALTGVAYLNEPSVNGAAVYPSGLVEARYAYNPDTAGGRPLLLTCEDPHFAGPMTNLRYAFNTGNTAEWGAVVSEAHDGPGAEVVSTLNRVVSTPGHFPTPGPTMISVETRGDGPQRTFKYGEGSTPSNEVSPYQLTSVTDFEGHTTSYTYDGLGYRRTLMDRRNNTFVFNREPYLGRVTRVDLPPAAPGAPAAQRYYEYTDAAHPDATQPYFLYKATDERGFNTIIHRDNPTPGSTDPNVHLITGVDYPDGGSEHFTYRKFTSNGADFYKLSTRTTVLNATLSYAYDEPGHGGSGLPGLLTSITRPWGDAGAGAVTVNYFYDGFDRLVRTRDERGNNSFIGDANGQGGYNGRQQVVRVTHADGSYVTSAYDDYGNSTQVVDELGHPVTTVFDDYRRPVRQIVQSNDPVSGIGSLTTAFFYDRVPPAGAPAQVAGDAFSHTTAAVGTLVLPSGKALQRAYTANETLLQETNGLLADANGNVQATPDVSTSSFTYDLNDNLASATVPASNGTTLTTSSTYDARNRLQTQTDPNGLVTTYTYDLASNLARVDLPLDAQSDPNRGPILYVDPNDPVNHNYDGMNRRRWTQDPKGQSTLVNYDPAGDVLSLTDGKQNVTNFGYDLLGRRRTVTYPPEGDTNAVRTEAWTYDEAGNLMTYKNRGDFTQTFRAYDNRNRPTGYDWSAGSNTSSVDMTFDAAGNLKTLNNAVSALSYDYNDANQLIRETQQIDTFPRTVTYNVNADALIQALGYPSGPTVSRQFNPRNDITQIGFTDGSASLATLSWNPDSTPLARDLGNGTHLAWTYDPNGRVNQTSHTQGGGQVISQRQYGYNPSNQLSWFNRVAEQPAAITYVQNAGDLTPRTSTAAGTGDACFYDPAGQLVSILQDAGGPQGQDAGNGNSYANAGAAGPRHQHGFVYDAAGNKTQANFDGSVTTYQPDALNRYLTSSNDGETDPFGYDALGNLTSRFGFSFSYDALSRLRTANRADTAIDGSPSNHSTIFAYDALGRCARRTVDGVERRLYYDGWDLIEERDASGVLRYLYVHGPGVDEMLCRVDSAGNRLFYHHDALGNVTHLTDAAGRVVESYRYMPYGRPEVFDAGGQQLLNELAEATSAVGNRFMFQGREYLEKNELYDYRHRHLLPKLGRFLQPDPAGFGASGANLYAFCGNDPVNGSDPSGLDENDSSGPSTVYVYGSYYPGAGLDLAGGGGGSGGSDQSPMTASVSYRDPNNHPPERVLVQASAMPNAAPFIPGAATLGGGGGGSSGSSIGIRILGLLRGISGTIAASFGAGGIVAPEPALTKVGGAALFLYGSDQAGAGFRQAFTGRRAQSLTEQTLGPKADAAIGLATIPFSPGNVARATTSTATLTADVASTFRGGNYGYRVLQRDVQAFRFSGGVSGPVGRFLTTRQTVTGIATPAEAISTLNLPSGATATQLNYFIIPKGTAVYFGRVEGGGATATQIFVPDPSVMILVP